MAKTSDRPFTSARIAAAGTMRVDATTAEVCGALSGSGVPHLLLKGPSLATLYDGDERRYGDTDLLVPPDSQDDAEHVLSSLGFSRPPSVSIWESHADPWERDGAEVDLHRTIPGCAAGSDVVWAYCWHRSTATDVAGQQVAILGGSFVPLQVALHTAHHGDRWTKPRNELVRAFERCSQDDWRAAFEHARALGALPAFVNALALEPEGRELIEAHRWRRHLDPWVKVHIGVTRATGHTLLRLRAVDQPFKIIPLILFPSRAYMRRWRETRGSTLARRFLWLAYVERLVVRLAALPRALGEIRRLWRR